MTSKPSVGHERRLVVRPLAVKRTVRSRSSGSTSPVTTEEGSASLGARGSLGVDLDLGTSWPGSVRGGGTVCGGAIGRTARGCFGRINTTGAADRRFRRRGGTGSPGQSETSASVEPSARASRPAGRPHVVVASDGAKFAGGEECHTVSLASVVPWNEGRGDGVVRRLTGFLRPPGRSRSERRVRRDVARLLAPELEGVPHPTRSARISIEQTARAVPADAASPEVPVTCRPFDPPRVRTPCRLPEPIAGRPTLRVSPLKLVNHMLLYRIRRKTAKRVVRLSRPPARYRSSRCRLRFPRPRPCTPGSSPARRARRS